jgi:hypothetical protein
MLLFTTNTNSSSFDRMAHRFLSRILRRLGEAHCVMRGIVQVALDRDLGIEEEPELRLYWRFARWRIAFACQTTCAPVAVHPGEVDVDPFSHSRSRLTGCHGKPYHRVNPLSSRGASPDDRTRPPTFLPREAFLHSSSPSSSLGGCHIASDE